MCSVFVLLNVSFSCLVIMCADVSIQVVSCERRQQQKKKESVIDVNDLFTHKEIDICGHIFHLLTKSITKRNSRTIMTFPTLIMGFIAKAKLKLLSSLTIVPRDYPIGAHIVTWIKAHIIGSKTGVSQIPRDRVEKEGGDTEDEIERFTSAPGSSAQPSSQA